MIAHADHALVETDAPCIFQHFAYLLERVDLIEISLHDAARFSTGHPTGRLSVYVNDHDMIAGLADEPECSGRTGMQMPEC